MAEFFVSKEEVADQGHIVHDQNCSLIGPVDNFKYLGSFATEEAAFTKSTGYFYKVTYCPSCIGEKANADSSAKAA